MMAVTSTRKASRDSVRARRCDIASRVVIDDRNDKKGRRRALLVPLIALVLVADIGKLKRRRGFIGIVA